MVDTETGEYTEKTPSHEGNPRRALQFRWNPQVTEDNSSDGRWSIRSRLVS